MSSYPVLFCEERQCFRNQQGPLAREIQTRERTFRRGGVKRILGPGGSVATAEGAEYLADVVQGFGPGVSGPDGQLLEQVVGAELHLQRVVARGSAIGTGASNAQIPGRATDGSRSNC